MDLTQEEVKTLFEYRDGHLYRRKTVPRSNVKVGDLAGYDNNGRWCIKIRGKLYKAHRLIYIYHHGSVPQYLDHKNRDMLDNHVKNLRPCNFSQNGMNRKTNKGQKSSKYKGVCWVKSHNMWKANIKKESKNVFLGYFKDEEKAARAYNTAAISLFGEFANLNFLTA